MRRASPAIVMAGALLLLTAPLAAAPADPPAAERYRIEGRPEADGCGGQIYLAARHLVLDRPRGRLFADVVDRTYAMTISGAGLRASGTFDGNVSCPRGVDETWDLRWITPTELRGTLSSTWRMRPSCEPCTVVFRLRATRVR